MGTFSKSESPIGGLRLTAMSDTYYVRSQGKVLGPFSFEDLKAKAQRGHLRKTHQVSADKQSWQPARKMEGLFPPPPKPPQTIRQEHPAPVKTPAEGEVIEVQLIEDLELVPADDELEWHFCLQGAAETQGPVTETQLRHFFQNGRLPLDTLVWNETFPDWVEADRVPAFQSAAPAAQPVMARPPAAEPVIFDAEPHLPPRNSGERPTPPLASASLILGILGTNVLFGVGSLLAVIFGHLALREIKSNPHAYSGEGMALTGLILGYAVLILGFLVLMAMFIIALAKA